MKRIYFFSPTTLKSNETLYPEIEKYIESCEKTTLQDHLIVSELSGINLLVDFELLKKSIIDAKYDKKNIKDMTVDIDLLIGKKTPERGWYVKGELQLIKSGKEREAIETLDELHGYNSKDKLTSWQKRNIIGEVFFYTARTIYLDGIDYLTREYNNKNETIEMSLQTINK